jgi:hypothetical protein
LKLYAFDRIANQIIGNCGAAQASHAWKYPAVRRPIPGFVALPDFLARSPICSCLQSKLAYRWLTKHPAGSCWALVSCIHRNEYFAARLIK